MTREEFDRWQLEHKLVEDLLARVEQAERAILEALHCPTDPVALFAILRGEQPAPWPAKTAARAKRRALHAMHVLVHVRSVRDETCNLDAGNPRLAAYHALLAGVYAGDAATNAVRVAEARATRRKATDEARRVKRAKRDDDDAGILRVARAHWAQHPRRSSLRATAEGIAPEVGLAPDTVRTRLAAIMAAGKKADRVRRK